MSHITRNNGDYFVIKPLRETIEAKGRSELLKHLRNGIREYGDYCHVREVAPDTYSLTYDQESGALLGEAIADYFNYPENLLWCEELESADSKTKRVAIVVIRDYQVKLDAEVPATAVADDISLSLGGDLSKQFDVYVHGNVPVKATINEASFNDVTLDSRRLKSFTVLEEGLIDRLEVKDKYLLTSPRKALKNAGFKSYKLVLFIAATVLASAMYHYITYEPPENKVVVVDDFKEYRESLNQLHPSQELLSFINYYSKTIDLSSWNIERVFGNGNLLSFTLSSTFKNYKELQHFAASNNGRLTLENGKAVLALPINSSTRPNHNLIAPEFDITSDIAQRLSFNPSFNVTTDTLSSTKYFKSREILVEFSSATATDLLWLAKSLDGMPLTFLELDSTINQVFLISGHIRFKTFGS
jgi:hypothetical protein